MGLDNKEKNNSILSRISNILGRPQSINLLCIAVAILFIITLYSMADGIKALLVNNKTTYIYEDGAKYKEIDGGFVINELILESGSALPTVQDYFNANYELGNDVKISYYNMQNKEINVDDFTVKINDDYFVKGIQDIFVSILNNSEEYSASVSILDTTTPEVTVSDYTIFQGEEYNARNFIVNYFDNSSINEYDAQFVGDANFSDVGEHDVKIRVCDSSDNCVEVDSKLIIKEKIVEEPIVTPQPQSSASASSQVVSKKNPNNTNKKPNGNSGNNGNNGNSGNNNNNNNNNSNIGGDKDYNSNNIGNTNSQKSTDPAFWELVEKAKAYNASPDYQRDKELVEKKFITKTNEDRRAAGVPELTLDPELCLLAQTRIREYESIGWDESPKYIHKRPDLRDFSTIFKDYGYVAGIYSDNQRHYGENYVSVLGGNNMSNDGAFKLLHNSPGHYANIVGPYYSKMGIAKGIDPVTKRLFWIQLFSS